MSHRFRAQLRAHSTERGTLATLALAACSTPREIEACHRCDAADRCPVPTTIRSSSASRAVDPKFVDDVHQGQRPPHAGSQGGGDFGRLPSGERKVRATNDAHGCLRATNDRARAEAGLRLRRGMFDRALLSSTQLPGSKHRAKSSAPHQSPTLASGARGKRQTCAGSATLRSLCTRQCDRRFDRARLRARAQTKTLKPRSFPAHVRHHNSFGTWNDVCSLTRQGDPPWPASFTTRRASSG